MRFSLSDLLLPDEVPVAIVPAYSAPGPYYVWNGKAAERGTSRNCLVPLMHPDAIDPETAVKELLVAASADPTTVRMTMTEDWAERTRRHFARVDLPWGAVVKNPDLKISVPGGIRVVESSLLPSGEFYCVTEPTFFGNRPIKGGRTGVMIGNLLGLITVRLE